VASGVRIGTPALTSRGMMEAQMQSVARLISRALQAVDNDSELATVKKDVHTLCADFPLYAERLKKYDEVLGA